MNALKDNIEIVDASKIDVMDEMVKSKLLITDYSSLGFDFTFLNKPVVLSIEPIPLSIYQLTPLMALTGLRTALSAAKTPVSISQKPSAKTAHVAITTAV